MWCVVIYRIDEPIIFLRTTKKHVKSHTITNNQSGKVLSLFQNNKTTVWRAIERIREDFIQLNQKVCNKDERYKSDMSW